MFIAPREMTLPFRLGEIKCAYYRNSSLGFIWLSERTREYIAFLPADFTHLITTNSRYPAVKLDILISKEEIWEGKRKEKQVFKQLVAHNILNSWLFLFWSFLSDLMDHNVMVIFFNKEKYSFFIRTIYFFSSFLEWCDHRLNLSLNCAVSTLASSLMWNDTRLPLFLDKLKHKLNLDMSCGFDLSLHLQFLSLRNPIVIYLQTVYFL